MDITNNSHTNICTHIYIMIYDNNNINSKQIVCNITIYSFLNTTKYDIIE